MGTLEVSDLSQVGFSSGSSVPQPPPSVYRPELDVLRFVSFLGVFAVHSLSYPVAYLVERHIPSRIAEVFQAFVHGGACGVDLFFVLSAYLITDLLLREKQAFGNLNVKAFYVRRALRIWPLYYCFVLLLFLAPSLDTGIFQSRFFAMFALFLGNWSFVWWGWPNSVLVPLWSVSVEEQFYLVWPPILSRMKRGGILAAAFSLCVVANVFRAYEIGVRNRSIQQLWANPLAHLDSFAIGMTIAVLLRGNAPKFRLATRVGLVLAGLSIIAVRGYFAGNDQLPQTILATVRYVAVVIGCGVLLFAFLGWRLRAPSWCYLGKISYGLYVYHLVAIRLATLALRGMRHGVLHELSRLLLSLSLTVVLSALSYSLLEKPFLKLKQRFTFVYSRPV